MNRIFPPEKNQVLNVVQPFQRVCTDFALFAMLLRNDLKAKFRHSILGVLWLFIPPVCVLLIYVYMFRVVFKMRWPESNFSSRCGLELLIYAGLTIYTAFSDSLMGSLDLLPSRANMLKRVPFPFELLPVSLVSVNMIVSAAVLWGLFLLSLATGGKGSWLALLYFPLIYLPFTLLCIGICWIFAALGVFFRDIGNLLGILLRLFFFSAPVVYSITVVPKQFLLIVRLNPMTPVIQNIRAIFLQNETPALADILWSWAAGIILFQSGYCFFQRMRRRFADVV